MQKLSFYGAWLLALSGLAASLKLSRYPDWSWWYVTAPLWLPVLLVAIGLTFVAIMIAIAAMISKDAN